jgi:hypothetical protein
MEEVNPLFDITDVTIYKFPSLSSGFGNLVPIEFGSLPFTPTRVFNVTDVPPGEERGLHAHRLCHQLLIAMSGDVLVSVSDGASSREFLLDNPREGLHVPPLIWASQSYLFRHSALTVLASHPYSRDDYIEDFKDFTIARLDYQKGISSA